MFISSPKNYGCGKNHGWETRSQLWTLGDDESSKVFKHKTSCLRSRLSTSRLTQSDLFYISLPIPFKINLMFIYKQGTVERKPLFIRPWGKWWHKEYHILNKYQVYKVYSEFLFYGYQVPTVPPFLIPPFSLWLIKKNIWEISISSYHP